MAVTKLMASLLKFKKIEFPDGKHWPTLASTWKALWLPKSKGKVSGVFLHDSIYHQPGGVDQGDYLKILGRKSIKQVIGPEGYRVSETETILSFRYNPDQENWELVWHRRRNGVRTTEHIQYVKVGEIWTVPMAPAKGSGIIPVTPYFGGTSVEPKDGKSTNIYIKKGY